MINQEKAYELGMEIEKTQKELIEAEQMSDEQLKYLAPKQFGDIYRAELIKRNNAKNINAPVR